MEIIIEVIKSIILGIVEGATEFLPVSSTGHLIIFQNLINFNSNTENYIEMYTYVIQLGAILAVVYLYRKKIIETLKDFSPKKKGFENSGFRFWLLIILACIPGGIATILLDDLADKYLFNPISVSIILILGAIFMIVTENKIRPKKGNEKEEIKLTVRQALTVGLFQCLAIMPGMSRSASTIIGGWFAGLSSVVAAEFSFFLAIPVMIGMSLLKIIKLGGFGVMNSTELLSLSVGFIVSFIIALLVIERFIAYLKKKPMKAFAVYRIIFGFIVFISAITGFIKSM